MATTNNKKKITTEKQGINWAPGMPFGKINYTLMLVGIVMLAIGYILLSGGGTDDPSQFSKAIFDTRRLTIAPIVLTLGFVVEFLAIMLKFNDKGNEGEKTSAEVK